MNMQWLVPVTGLGRMRGLASRTSEFPAGARGETTLPSPPKLRWVYDGFGRCNLGRSDTGLSEPQL